jgi:carbamoylphosphate synthase small subunit
MRVLKMEVVDAAINEHGIKRTTSQRLAITSQHHGKHMSALSATCVSVVSSIRMLTQLNAWEGLSSTVADA